MRQIAALIRQSKTYIKKTGGFKGFALTLLLLYIIAAFALFPERYLNSVKNGLYLFSTCVLPALFPFFFLTKLLTAAGNVSFISNLFKKPCRKLFKMPPVFSYVFFMSALSGYPVGAKLSSELMPDGDRTANTRLAAICSTSGPVFILGTVGFSMLGGKGAGLLILCSHLLAVLTFALANAPFVKRAEPAASDYVPQNASDNVLSESVYSSVISILMVGGFITLFYTFIDMLASTFLFKLSGALFFDALSALNLPADLFRRVFSGLMEMTRGCREIADSLVPFYLKVCCCAFTVTFGGACVMLQSFAFLSGKIRCGLFILYKLLQAALSFIICLCLCGLFNISSAL